VIPKPQAQTIIDKHGPDRILFASDMPWQRVRWELRLIDSLELSQEDKEKIFFRNARKLLNL
jgi:predicted TIM-barrel fold metal-dependent hydrolase